MATFFLLQGLQLLSFPKSAGDPRAQISKLADLFYMLREGIAVNEEWLSSDKLGLIIYSFIHSFIHLFIFFLMLFGEVRAGMVFDQNEQAS